MDQQIPIPLNQGSNRAKAKTRYFLILDLGEGEGGGVQISHLFCPRLYGKCQRHEIVVTLH